MMFVHYIGKNSKKSNKTTNYVNYKTYREIISRVIPMTPWLHWLTNRYFQHIFFKFHCLSNYETKGEIIPISSWIIFLIIYSRTNPVYSWLSILLLILFLYIFIYSSIHLKSSETSLYRNESWVTTYIPRNILPASFLS